MLKVLRPIAIFGFLVAIMLVALRAPRAPLAEAYGKLGALVPPGQAAFVVFGSPG